LAIHGYINIILRLTGKTGKVGNGGMSTRNVNVSEGRQKRIKKRKKRSRGGEKYIDMKSYNLRRRLMADMPNVVELITIKKK